MAMLELDGFALPEDPREDYFSGIQKEKLRSDIRTFGGNISFVWDPVISDVTCSIKWSWMNQDDYETLKTKYESSPDATFIFKVYSPYVPGTYVVEFTELRSTPFRDYFRDVEVRLKILEEV